MTSISVDTIVQQLAEGEATFSFRKSDGTTRTAKGTTKVDLIPEGSRAASAPAANAPTVAFFDLDANEWRSFRRDSLVG